MVFTITGDRLPWQPIVRTDGNSGAAARQLVFTACAAVAGWRALRAGAIGQLFGLRASLVGLVGLIVLSAAWSTDASLTLRRATIAIFGTIVLVAAVHVPRRPVRFLQSAVVGVTSVAAAISLAASVALPADTWSIEERQGLAGVAGHPNTLGPAMVVGIVVSIGMRPASARWSLVLWGARAFLAIALVRTDSITSIAVCGVAVALTLALRGDLPRRGAVLLLAVAAALAVAFVGLDRVTGFGLDAAGRDRSLSGRDSLWARVFEEGLRRPLFGGGYGAFWYERRGRELTGTWNPRQSHNAYLDVFVELGVVGLLAVVGFLGASLTRAWQRLRGSPGSARRTVVSSLVALGAALLVYGTGESFLLKFDKTPFFVLLWLALLLSNPDVNGIRRELPDDGPGSRERVA
jgi:O-antigen ligase